jgi:hypothetical protein
MRALRDCGVPLSVDTRKPEVMRAVLDEGADMINDVAGFATRRRSRRCAERGRLLRDAHARRPADDAAGPRLSGRRRRGPRLACRAGRPRCSMPVSDRRGSSSTRASASARRSSTTSRCSRGCPSCRRRAAGAGRRVAQVDDRALTDGPSRAAGLGAREVAPVRGRRVHDVRARCARSGLRGGAAGKASMALAGRRAITPEFVMRLGRGRARARAARARARRC